MKIDNNPFAKGFRETGQSRCKRKTGSSPNTSGSSNQSSNQLKIKSEEDFLESSAKRMRSSNSVCSNGSLDDSGLSVCETSSSGTSSPSNTDDRLMPSTSSASSASMMSSPYFNNSFNPHQMNHLNLHNPNEFLMHQYQHMMGLNMNNNWLELLPYMNRHHIQQEMPAIQALPPYFSPASSSVSSKQSPRQKCLENDDTDDEKASTSSTPNKTMDLSSKPAVVKKCNFSISAILGHDR